MSRKCIKCGRCCTILLQANGYHLRYRTAIHCPAYNKATGLCDIYEQRQRIGEIVPGFECNMAQDMIDRALQPSGCTMARNSYRSICVPYDGDTGDLQRIMDGYRVKVLEWFNSIKEKVT